MFLAGKSSDAWSAPSLHYRCLCRPSSEHQFPHYSGCLCINQSLLDSMALRLRSGKGFTRGEILIHQEAVRSGTANSTGLPALPTELLLEIMSHFPAVPLPLGEYPYDQCMIYSALYLEKPRILRVLSQMCRSLRSIFLPYVWQTIEVCASHRISEGPTGTSHRPDRALVSKELATELITQLEIVTIRDPTLAHYVKIVNVLLMEYSVGAVLKELVRCLALFPNLHTVQLFSDRRRLEEPVSIAFKGKLFPSVRTVTFNQPTLPILASFPEARNVPLLPCDDTLVLDRLCQHCPKLEVLRGFEYVDYRQWALIQRMVTAFPKTRTMVLTALRFSTLDEINLLSKFPDLTCIELRVYDDDEGDLSTHDKQLINKAEKILQDKPGVDGLPKCVILKLDYTTCRIVIP